MIVTGVIQGDERDQVSGEGPSYEAAKAQMMARIPDGFALIAIHTDRDV